MYRLGVCGFTHKIRNTFVNKEKNNTNSKKIKNITGIVRGNNYLINFTDKSARESDIPHSKVIWAILAKSVW